MQSDGGRSDALVFFGITGDLAYKKIFPALHAMARRGKLDVPVIGFARSNWTREQVVERARDSITAHGELDDDAFATLASLIRYVDGDYNDPSTFTGLEKLLSDCSRPAHYLAIPPSMFETVVEGDVTAEAHQVLRLTTVRLRYALTIPKGTRAAAERAAYRSRTS